ncbi:MAG: hypothetical protein ACKV2U_32030 [Bryobacteraceae bacterium]
MSYIFNGKLCGLICPECPEPLSNVKVRLYRSRQQQNITALAVANPKDTFTILTDEMVEAKASFLLAETTTDSEGTFSFELTDKNKYAGEAFEVDVYCETVPRRKPGPNPHAPRQFSITTLQPMWKRTETGFIAAWDYCIPSRFWCAFRALFGAWTICGRVTICGTRTLAANVTVSAFDVDWLQNDPLGSGVTNAAGKFRIDYVTSDFLTTIFSPIINVELTSGPDLYFKVESGGTVLLDEPPSRGRQKDRENVGPCFCVDLCVDTDQPPPFKNPLFTNVGDFHIGGDINALTGLTNSAVLGHGGPGFGFFGNLKLRGFCPKTSPIGAPDPMRYRFLYVHPSAPGTPVPITPDKIYPVLVGSRLLEWDVFGTGLIWTFQSIYIQGSGATLDPTPTPVLPPGTPWGAPPAHVIVPAADGWIKVDQTALDDGFYGPLVRFMSDTAVPGGAAPGSGAGVVPAAQKNGVSLRIIFEAGPIGGGVTFTNELSNILINNWGEVNQINLLQFHSPGATACSEITDAIDIEYTADHELIAAWNVGISSAAAFPPPPPLPGGTVPRGGFGTRHVDVSLWPSCSYVVTLSTRRKLTDGEIDDSTRTNMLTFCK